MRAARARELVASGEQPTAVARVAQISRQAIYQPPRRRPLIAGPRIPVPGDAAIVEIAKAHPTDGTRMVAAIASREFGEAVNRKRVQRIMRAHRLLQPVRGLDRRRRPGFFRVRRPDELWHMDMTKVWTAAHGWVYLHVIIDCCTREIAAWTLDLRCRTDEAIACVDAGLLGRNMGAQRLTIGTDHRLNLVSSRRVGSFATSPTITSATAAAVTATPNRRRSSSRGSGSSRNASRGAPNGKPLTKQGETSPHISTSTTTGPTRA